MVPLRENVEFTSLGCRAASSPSRSPSGCGPAAPAAPGTSRTLRARAATGGYPPTSPISLARARLSGSTVRTGPRLPRRRARRPRARRRCWGAQRRQHPGAQARFEVGTELQPRGQLCPQGTATPHRSLGSASGRSRRHGASRPAGSGRSCIEIRDWCELLEREGSVRDLAERFAVAPNTVQNYLSIRAGRPDRTGSCAPRSPS